MTTQVFKPRVWPRDALDLVLTIAVGLVQFAILYGLPFLLSVWAFSTVFAGLAAIVGVYALFLLFSVWSVKVSPEGIRLSRLVGDPKFVPWHEIISVEEAPRSEVMWFGWLWPVFPAREMTPSLTAKGHYRVRFGKRYFYFPFQDPERFMAIVRKCARGTA